MSKIAKKKLGETIAGFWPLARPYLIAALVLQFIFGLFKFFVSLAYSGSVSASLVIIAIPAIIFIANLFKSKEVAKETWEMIKPYVSGLLAVIFILGLLLFFFSMAAASQKGMIIGFFMMIVPFIVAVADSSKNIALF